jgi:hypothetical protein
MYRRVVFIQELVAKVGLREGVEAREKSHAKPS